MHVLLMGSRVPTQYFTKKDDIPSCNKCTLHACPEHAVCIKYTLSFTLSEASAAPVGISVMFK